MRCVDLNSHSRHSYNFVFPNRMHQLTNPHHHSHIHGLADIIVDGYIVSAACVFLCRSQIENPSVGDVLGALSLADKTLDHDDNITQHLLILAEDMLGQDSFLMKKEVRFFKCTHHCSFCVSVSTLYHTICV